MFIKSALICSFLGFLYWSIVISRNFVCIIFWPGHLGTIGNNLGVSCFCMFIKSNLIASGVAVSLSWASSFWQMVRETYIFSVWFFSLSFPFRNVLSFCRVFCEEIKKTFGLYDQEFIFIHPCFYAFYIQSGDQCFSCLYAFYMNEGTFYHPYLCIYLAGRGFVARRGPRTHFVGRCSAAEFTNKVAYNGHFSSYDHRQEPVMAS